jgi:hypothetical protein
LQQQDQSRMLSLRRQLLQRLVDEGGKARVDSLSEDMQDSNTHFFQLYKWTYR